MFWPAEVILSLLALVVIGALISYGFMTLPRKARMVNRFPGATLCPFVGTVYNYFGHFDDLTGRVSQEVREYGRVQRLWILHRPIVGLHDATAVQRVMESMRGAVVEKGDLYNAASWFFGNGLVTSDYHTWKKDRKLLNPSFKYQKFDGFLDSFNKNGKILVRVLENAFKSTEFQNLLPTLTHCTMDTVTEATLGMTSTFQEKLDKMFLQQVATVLESVRWRVIKPWLFLAPIFQLSGMAKKEEKAVAYIAPWFTKMIQERRLNRQFDEDKEGTKPFLDILLDSRSEQDIFDQVVTVFGAGFETSASALNYTLYLLAVNPLWQRKVHQEIDQVFGDDPDRTVTFGDLSKLKLVEMCVKESLRIYPAVPAVSRVAPHDIALGNGLVIPKGVDIFFYMFEIHRDPSVWEEPEKFDPLRFLPERCVSRSPYAYMPFAAGPRNCIGRKYAMIQLVTLLSLLLKSFSVTTSTDPSRLKVNYGLVLEPRGGLFLKLEPRV